MPDQIAFIGCSKSKNNAPCEVSKMYQGALFKKSLAYCRREGFKKIFVLSAKYGLLELTDKIESYELTLNSFSKKQLRDWSKKVELQLMQKKIKGEFYFFCGENYHREFDGIKPLKGLSIGHQLRWFNLKLKKKGKLL